MNKKKTTPSRVALKENTTFSIAQPKKKRLYKLKKNKLPMKLLSAVQAGGKKTKLSWAKYFNVSQTMLNSALISLRKHNYLIYPIGKKNTYPTTPGILIDISENPEMIRETLEYQNKVYIKPQLDSAFRIFEKAVSKYPEMYDYMESRLIGLTTSLLMEKESFKAYANHKSLPVPNQTRPQPTP